MPFLRPLLCSILLLALAATAVAQDAADEEATDDWTQPQEESGDTPTSTLDTIRVTAPRPQLEDPFAFRNPIAVDENHFDRYYREPPSPEELGMQGGLLAIGIGYLLQKVELGSKRLPGWKQQVVHATARPPPLDDEHLARAHRLREQEEEVDEP